MGAFQNAEEGLGLKPDLIIVIGNPDLAPPLKLRRYAVRSGLFQILPIMDFSPRSQFKMHPRKYL